MKKKIKIILILLTISVTLSYMSDTYSRYVISANNNVDISFSSWQILINDFDITNNTNNTLEITPVIEESKDIKANTIAPSSKGYFDILINPSNVELSFNYTVDLKILNENLPDILISKYAILDEDYNEKDEITTTAIEENKIKGSLTFDNNTENFKFKPFIIRIYFEWFEGENEQMDDQKDTEVTNDALNNNTKLQIEANITFEQKLSSEEDNQE